MHPLPLALLVALALFPLATGETSAPYAPLAVTATPAEGGLTVVTWIPGEVSADSYLVYGLSSTGAPTLLLDTSTTEGPGAPAVVPAGFATYAVSGLLDGRESARVTALEVFASCIGYFRIDIDPPGVTICKILPFKVNRPAVP